MVTEGKLKLADVIAESNIVEQLAAVTREAAIKELVGVLAAGGAIPKARIREVSEAILAREKLGSTGIGRGVAVPHVKVSFLKEPVGALGKSPEGIDFASLDGSITRSVFLFVSPQDPPEKHVALMSRFVTLLRKADFLNFLSQTEGSRALHDFLHEIDEW